MNSDIVSSGDVMTNTVVDRHLKQIFRFSRPSLNGRSEWV